MLMSIIPGIVFSRARWRAIRKRNDTMDRNVYLDNDHLIDYRVEERTTGKFISDLSLTARLSRNPTGSAVQSFFLDGGTSSLVSASQFDVGTTQFIAAIDGQSDPLVTQSILQITTQSLFTEFTGSNSGNVVLTASLTETPVRSGHYEGVIRGADISTALSQSLSSSFSQTFSSSFWSASFDTGTLIISAGLTTSVAFTASVTGLTSSITQSVLEQFPESDYKGIFEIIQSGSFLKATTAMTLRSVRYLP
ncbi:hypothetical protein LCGC14_1075200 [marine sediment metagenome]|uniref:Uncharacterized protein n=1 Tax=marine sediment metagenome TaxID=412755 RepID=A0A0F9MLN9_9ZZZZ